MTTYRFTISPGPYNDAAIPPGCCRFSGVWPSRDQLRAALRASSVTEWRLWYMGRWVIASPRFAAQFRGWTDSLRLGKGEQRDTTD